jgi:cytochrome c biogenesis protein CcmG, thiol:disulfide interchange protein DsbE
MRKLSLLLSLIVVLAACRRDSEKADAIRGFGTTAERTKSAPAQTATGTDVGATMPEYSAMWLDGSKFELASKRDKVVLVNVWATWCGPCRVEIPELQALHNKLNAKGFEVIGVSVDDSSAELVKQFVAEQKMTFPVALDPEGKIASILDTGVLPTSVLLDRTGKILWKHYGPIPKDDKELDQAIAKAL